MFTVAVKTWAIILPLAFMLLNMYNDDGFEKDLVPLHALYSQFPMPPLMVAIKEQEESKATAWREKMVKVRLSGI